MRIRNSVSRLPDIALEGGCEQGAFYMSDDNFNLAAIRFRNKHKDYQIILTPYGLRGWDLEQAQEIGFVNWS